MIRGRARSMTPFEGCACLASRCPCRRTHDRSGDGAGAVGAFTRVRPHRHPRCQWKRRAKGSRCGPGVTLDLPIFNRNQGGIARATVEIERASRLYIAARSNVIADVRSAGVRVTQAQQALDAWTQRHRAVARNRTAPGGKRLQRRRSSPVQRAGRRVAGWLMAACDNSTPKRICSARVSRSNAPSAGIADRRAYRSRSVSAGP